MPTSMPPRVASPNSRPSGPVTRATASPLPVIVGASAMLVSVLLAVVVALTASAPIVFLVPLPLVRAEAFWMSLLGYLLTPIVVIACYGWDALSQRNGLRANRNFDIRPQWTRLLLWLCGFSIIVGAWHILNLSVPLSEWLGLS